MTTINLKQLNDSQLIQLQESVTDELKVRLTVGRTISTTMREQAINNAKNIIEEGKDKDGDYRSAKGPMGPVEFIVNKEKRTVAAIHRGFMSKKIRGKGIAKADPNDCFNVHIGKAIALLRALGKEVPKDLLNAPQPTTFNIGDIIEHKVQPLATYRIDALKTTGANCTIVSNKHGSDMTGEKAFGGDFGWAKVIDDSKE